MTVFVKTISELVALFLQSLRLSFILPAALFVTVNLTFILPRFKDTPFYSLVERMPSSSFALLTGFAIMLVAYTLATMNLTIIRFFEGYPLLSLPIVRLIGERLRLANYRRVLYLQNQIELYDRKAKGHRKRAEELSAEDRHEEAGREASNAIFCEAYRNALNNELIWLYPHHQIWRILPTRLGNVIAAAEEYPGHLFGIDSVTLWPFLVPILEDEKYASFVEREKAFLDFPLNLAALTLVFGAETIYVDLLLREGNGYLYLVKLLIISLVAFSFYLISIQGALSWGFTIRTAFVLFRNKLRLRLGLVCPEGYYEERNLWRLASRFYRDHDPTPGRFIFEYIPDKDQEKGEKRPC